METLAKKVVLCDSCGAPFKAYDENRDLRIKATLSDDNGKNKSFDLCTESCLLQFLQKRAKKRTSKACLLDAVFTVK